MALNTTSNKVAKGKFYDGQAGGSYDVTISSTSSSLLIEDGRGQLKKTWHFRDIKILEKEVGNQPAKLTNLETPDARLHITPDEQWKALKEKLPRSCFPGLHLPSSWSSFIGYAGASVAIVIAFFTFAPKIFESAAHIIPYSLEKELGEYVTQQIISDMGAVCDNKKGQKALDALVKKLQEHGNRDINYTVRVVKNEDVLNALAAPGGHIIFFSSVIDKADGPDEVAGVLAHEMAHIELLHATKGLMRDIGIASMAAFMFGDVSAINVVHSLHSLHYSREDEAEADAMGLSLLSSANINPLPLATFFERVQEQEKEIFSVEEENDEDIDIRNSKVGKYLDYLSTHPKTEH